MCMTLGRGACMVFGGRAAEPPEEDVMRGVVAGWMGVVMLLAGATAVSARGERELSDDEFRAEVAMNRALAAYVARNGDPDVAEAHFLADTPPWDDHEVTLYYLDMRKEIGFARAWVLGQPIVQIQRYERPLTDQQIAALSTRVHKRTAESGPAERAEDAARRAEAAADRIDAATEAAEHAADTAEAIGKKAEGEFHRSLRK